MVNKLSIKNYKSIKDLELDTKRVNIFIGEHNSGKSNILEALTWFSTNALDSNIFPELFRYKNVGNFFYDFDGTKTIEVSTDEIKINIKLSDNNIFPETIGYKDLASSNSIELLQNTYEILLNPNRGIYSSSKIIHTAFRCYNFKRLSKFEISNQPFLSTPFGENIPMLLQSNAGCKKLVSDFFRSKGFRLVMKPTENEIEMAKDVNDELTAFPYQVLSETMQRFVFLLLAIESNTNASIILDEPESNMFPFFVKDFAERIADNKSNQFFISTHNPYLLGSLLEKTPLDEVAVFITSMEDYQTKVKVCSNENINEILSLGSGAFFNLANLIEG